MIEVVEGEGGQLVRGASTCCRRRRPKRVPEDGEEVLGRSRRLLQGQSNLKRFELLLK